MLCIFIFAKILIKLDGCLIDNRQSSWYDWLQFNTSCQCFKSFFGGNLDFPIIKKVKKVSSDVWTRIKCENNAVLNQNYALKLFTTFKMAYSCCFNLGWNLDIPESPPKKFYNIDYSCQRYGTFLERFKISSLAKTTSTDIFKSN